MPFNVQALKDFHDSVSESFQMKNTHFKEFPEEREEDTAFLIIQKIQNQLQVIQWNLHLDSNSIDPRQVFQSISNSRNRN